MREESINGPAGSLAAADFGGSGPDGGAGSLRRWIPSAQRAIVAGHIREFIAQL